MQITKNFGNKNLEIFALTFNPTRNIPIRFELLFIEVFD